MEELLFSAFDAACIIDNFDLPESKTNELINRMWSEDKSFLLADYRQNYRKWILDVRYWSNYLYDKVTFDKEFPAIQVDCGDLLNDENFVIDNFNIDLFFKSLRIKILYIGEKKYVRMKLRTLLSAYGYKRRSKEFILYIKNCLMFYHIHTSFHGEICDVAEMSLDDMITFRVI